MQRLGLVAVLLLAASPMASSQVPDDRLIVPGVRIGRWTLSMTVDQFLRINGPATRVEYKAGGEFAADAIRHYTMLTWQNRLPLGPATYDEKTVAFLEISWVGMGNGNNLWAMDVFRPGTAAKHWHLI